MGEEVVSAANSNNIHDSEIPTLSRVTVSVTPPTLNSLPESPEVTPDTATDASSTHSSALRSVASGKSDRSGLGDWMGTLWGKRSKPPDLDRRVSGGDKTEEEEEG